MNEWTVVTVISVLSGLVLAFVKPLVSLNNTLTRLADEVEVLHQELSSLSGQNREEHARLWAKAAEQDKCLQEFELRLSRIESK